jgi:hypothetical protein
MHKRHRILLLTIPLATSALSTNAATAALRIKPKSTPVAAPTLGAKPALADVARLTTESSTLSYSMATTITMGSGGKSMSGTIVATGELDKGQKSSRLSMDLGPYLSSLAAGAGQALPPELADPSLFKMQAITTGSNVWMSYPLLAKANGVANPKPWIQINATEFGMTGEQIAASQGADPSQGLQYLKGLGSEAKVVGPEQVDGVGTTHYSSAVSLAALTKTATPAQMIQIKEVFGDKPVLPVDIWVDAQGRARRFDLSITTKLTGVQMSMKSSYKFGKFGEPVSISAPPADQVMELSDSPVLQKALTQKR